MSQSRGRIGIAAVVLGVVALGSAIIPAAIFEIPPPWPTQPAAEPRQVVEGGKTLEWKGMKLTIGGTTKLVEPPPPPPPPIAAKVVFIATAVISLAGIAKGLSLLGRNGATRSAVRRSHCVRWRCCGITYSSA